MADIIDAPESGRPHLLWTRKKILVSHIYAPATDNSAYLNRLYMSSRRRDLVRTRLGDRVAAAMVGSWLLSASSNRESAVTRALRAIRRYHSPHKNVLRLRQ
jgi:hypothetical protein